MPPTNTPSTLIGMTITTSAHLQSSASAADESNQRKMNQRRMLQLMQHPPPPPPITSVLVRSQSTTDRRSLTGYAGDIYDNSDDDSVSSCSMEVISVNAPYDYYNRSSCGESSLRPQKCCGGAEDDDEENSTTDSTGSADEPAYCIYYQDDAQGRRPSGTRRISPRKSQPQQMARILACSSPEITALCKSSFQQLSKNNHDDSDRRRLRQQVPTDMMSIGSYHDTADGVTSPPPDVLMESMSTSKSLFLPPLCPPPALQREHTAPESLISPVRTTDHSFFIKQAQYPPMSWTDVWLRDGRDATVEASVELIPSSSSETDDPHTSFRSSSYPMLHYSDSCICMNGSGRSSRYLHHQQNTTSSPVTLKSLIAAGINRYREEANDNDGVAVRTESLSKLSLHRRVSIDRLPSWNDIVVATTNSTHSDHVEAAVIPSNHQNTKDYNASNDTSKQLEKLVLQKNLTVVSDETMRWYALYMFPPSTHSPLGCFRAHSM